MVRGRHGDRLRVVYDIRDHLMIDDPSGAVETLLARLCEGGRAVAGPAWPGRWLLPATPLPPRR